MNRKTLELALKKVEDKNGEIDPHKLLEAARRKEHVLHNGYGFDWNDKSAATKYNLDVARRLISMRVRVVHKTTTVSCPVYVRNPEKQPGEPGYRSIYQIRDEKENARDVVIAELQRVQSALERAKAVAGALGLSSEFGALLEAVTGLRLRAEGSIAA
jgi:hypothetical protein